tara:strand:- start:2 stop:205 length:204 start_codon:yes stop_codon:yes gene_type:complete
MSERLELLIEKGGVINQLIAVTNFWVFYIANTKEERINGDISRYYTETIDALREQEEVIQTKLDEEG